VHQLLKQTGTGDGPASRIFPPESWERDRLDRYQICPTQQTFYRHVPALRFLSWKIEEIGRGHATTRLPLNVESSNQYITQQAALMLLAADYTGGIALSTLFKDAPVIGFHSQKTAYGAYLWGAAATIKWVRPSTDDLILTCSIAERDWDGIAEAFGRGDEVSYKARIKMRSGGRLAAVSDFQYWARNSFSLANRGATTASTHHMFAHKLKTSARLIAGLRSGLRNENGLLDPFAADAAGPQGRTMARKFCIDTPQLENMILARTVHCDEALSSFARKHRHFAVVNIGSGYDARPWRIEGLGNATFIHLDLPIMSEEAATALPSASASKYRILRRSFDLVNDDVRDTLQDLREELSLPLFFIWEGGSMYFSRQTTSRLLDSVSNLMCADSRIWFDQVSDAAVTDRTGQPEVMAFMDSMRTIGEPFIRGYGDRTAEIERDGFRIEQRTTAAQTLNTGDPIYDHYSFAVCARDKARKIADRS